jgi:large subunit ribosomal protein L24
MRIRKNDSVVVLTGDDAGSTVRKVVQVVNGGSHVLVESVNRAFKHVRRGHAKSSQGGRLSIEMPISASKVAIYCRQCKRGVKTARRMVDGEKHRHCKRCGCDLEVRTATP